MANFYQQVLKTLNVGSHIYLIFLLYNVTSNHSHYYSPLLLKSSSSDSKKGSVSSVKSSSENTGSASDSNEKSFCCGLCGNLLVVFRDGLTPRRKGKFGEDTWVICTWFMGWWSFSLCTEFSEKTEKKISCKLLMQSYYSVGQLFIEKIK